MGVKNIVRSSVILARQIRWVFLLPLLMTFACSDGKGSAPAVNTTLMGKAYLNGPLAGAAVELRDADGQVIETESATTSDSGAFLLKVNVKLPASFEFVISGGSIRGTDFEGHLRGYGTNPHAVHVVEIQSTLVATYMESVNVDYLEALEAVGTYLDLPQGVVEETGRDTWAQDVFFNPGRFLMEAEAEGGFDSYVEHLAASVIGTGQVHSYGTPLLGGPIFDLFKSAVKSIAKFVGEKIGGAVLTKTGNFLIDFFLGLFGLGEPSNQDIIDAVADVNRNVNKVHEELHFISTQITDLYNNLRAQLIHMSYSEQVNDLLDESAEAHSIFDQMRLKVEQYNEAKEKNSSNLGLYRAAIDREVISAFDKATEIKAGLGRMHEHITGMIGTTRFFDEAAAHFEGENMVDIYLSVGALVFSRQLEAVAVLSQAYRSRANMTITLNKDKKDEKVYSENPSFNVELDIILKQWNSRWREQAQLFLETLTRVAGYKSIPSDSPTSELILDAACYGCSLCGIWPPEHMQNELDSLYGEGTAAALPGNNESSVEAFLMQVGLAQTGIAITGFLHNTWYHPEITPYGSINGVEAIKQEVELVRTSNGDVIKPTFVYSYELDEHPKDIRLTMLYPGLTDGTYRFRAATACPYTGDPTSTPGGDPANDKYWDWWGAYTGFFDNKACQQIFLLQHNYPDLVIDHNSSPFHVLKFVK